jgi:hypothetical protein
MQQKRRQKGMQEVGKQRQKDKNRSVAHGFEKRRRWYQKRRNIKNGETIPPKRAPSKKGGLVDELPAMRNDNQQQEG